MRFGKRLCHRHGARAEPAGAHDGDQAGLEGGPSFCATACDAKDRRAPSLKRRLLLALLLTVLLNWGAWFAMQAVQMGRQQTGSWDAELEDVAQKVLLSLPGPMEPSSGMAGFRLPENMQRKQDTDGLRFQVWQLDGSRALVLRSSEAPLQSIAGGTDGLGYSDTVIGGEPWRVYALNDRDNRVQVQVGHPISQRRAEFHKWMRESLNATAVLFALLSLSVFCVLRHGLRSIDSLRAAMQQRDPFDLTPLPTRDTPVELRPLIASINRLLARLETALTRERRLIADAAHELRTPLAVLTTQAEVARGSMQMEDKDQALDKLLGAARRATRLSEQLLDQARLDALERAPSEPVELAALVALMVRDHESAARAKGQRVVLDVQPCTIAGDLDALGILVSNLVDNALRYTPEGGRIDVSCGPHEGGGALLRVADNGPGVPEDERGSIFQRFYRAQGTATRGSGIGLSLVAQIAQLHSARIECCDGLDSRGFCVEVYFPAPATATPAAA
ncbi:ATP-binding protein [Bordetella genomosp. 13]|uniref:ATP-binding protein n=1 Tax=Bordetella genomosp. 13 TaxID=463040 RepID=UPI00119D9630|nr:ATP-binding protein [Bordetella genomosp. 13]